MEKLCSQEKKKKTPDWAVDIMDQEYSKSFRLKLKKVSTTKDIWVGQNQSLDYTVDVH